MVDKALKFLQQELNEYLKPKVNVQPNEEAIILANLVSQKGAPEAEKVLALTLVNIEEERTVRAQSPYRNNGSGSIAVLNPELKLNLYLLVSANFETKDYEGALKRLSFVISFFQGKNVFDPQNSPALDPLIQKLIVDLHTISFEQQNQLWASLGAKYVPSVLYKVRMLVVQEAPKQAAVPVKETETNTVTNN